MKLLDQVAADALTGVSQHFETLRDVRLRDWCVVMVHETTDGEPIMTRLSGSHQPLWLDQGLLRFALDREMDEAREAQGD